jgi:transcriptional regulator with XRE-family HTH domain/tetratricopeptide (TPR) repeat protein
MARREALIKRRKAFGFTQQSLADSLGLEVTTVRNWELGRYPPSAQLRPKLAGALQVDLEVLDLLLGEAPSPIPSPRPVPAVSTSNLDLLGSKLTSRIYRDTDVDSETSAKPGIVLADGTPLPVSFGPGEHELDALLLSQLSGWAALDNQLGPGRLRPLVAAHIGVIEQMLDQARGADFRRLAYITARHSEFAGWVSQDAGDFDAAMRWTDTALEAARLITDRELEAYVLMRKSNIATDSGNPPLAVALANAAWHTARPLSGPLLALAARQRAHALTASGETLTALKVADTARQSLLTGPVPESADLTGYCTLEYLDMESASVLVAAGNAAEAVPILEAGLAAWNPGRRRDLGLCLARLAQAYARLGESATAAHIAVQAADIATATESHRTRQVLVHVVADLDQLGSADDAHLVREAL